MHPKASIPGVPPQASQAPPLPPNVFLKWNLRAECCIDQVLSHPTCQPRTRHWGQGGRFQPPEAVLSRPTAPHLLSPPLAQLQGADQPGGCPAQLTEPQRLLGSPNHPHQPRGWRGNEYLLKGGTRGASVPPKSMASSPQLHLHSGRKRGR